jgi:sarcosine oxidase, subunit beta
MAMAADILIIGGGSTGASIAYHLAAARAGQITLLERNTLASGTTGRSSAIIRQHYSIPTLARMAQRSLRTFQHFEEEFGRDVGFHTTGLLIGARAQDVDGLRATVDMHHELGIDSRMIDRDDLRALEPRMLADDLVGACHEPDAGYADPVSTTMTYAHRARQLGAQIRQRTPVQSLLLDGDRVRGVLLDDGTEVETRMVVMAANVWGVKLLADAGITVPVHASRHACILLQQPANFGPQHAILLDFTNGLYLKPEGENLTMAGTLDEAEAAIVDPDHFNAMPTRGEEEHYAERTARRIPAMGDATLQAGWAGLYDVSDDWQPLIGTFTGIEGLFCALGFSGHGFKLCPAIGELVTAMLLGHESPGVDRSIFSPDRFAGGKTSHSTYAYGIIG